MSDLLTQSEIEDALQELGKLARENGTAIELIMVGGAAMALGYGTHEVTKDVDAYILKPPEARLVRQFAARVAETRNWDADWLNDGAKGFMDKIERGKLIFRSPGIKVYAAPTAQLLAMKLSAWRDQADIDDAQTLLKYLPGSFDPVWDSVRKYIPKGWELKAKLAFEVLWEASER